MVRVEFDYGNNEDRELVKEMLGGQEAVETTPAKPAAEKPAAQKPAAQKPAAEKPAAEKPAAEKPAAPAKELTADQVTPAVAKYCQENGVDKPQAYIQDCGVSHITEMDAAQLQGLVDHLGIEV